MALGFFLLMADHMTVFLFNNVGLEQFTNEGF